jgi:hypothetical protein
LQVLVLGASLLFLQAKEIADCAGGLSSLAFNSHASAP